MNMEEDELFTKKRHKTIGTVQIQHQVDPNWGNTDKVSVSTSGTTSTILLSFFSFSFLVCVICAKSLLSTTRTHCLLRPGEDHWSRAVSVSECCRSSSGNNPTKGVCRSWMLERYCLHNHVQLFCLFIDFVHHTCSHANTEMFNLITLFYNLWF